MAGGRRLTTFDTLDQRRQRAIAAVVSAPSLEVASQTCGMSLKTLYRWMDESTFRQAYREARYAAMDEALHYLQRCAAEAARIIVGVMHDDKALPGVRLRAAEAVLHMAAQSRQIDDMEDRLARVEAALTSTHAA